ncbi:cytochrome oxidase subunit III [Zhengella mangrovi]|uniref:Cytochrome oxidase subunit III n=1 Tax=Zhengella mangrovi TaxID=1982044 RepID=A0A2G1QN82_9HYPH|nr:cytochrome oxidase subunit III [Zhengella mangrovi]PHP66910.1 cytochrome oxidase subunit III [Zhengella mangrovi]
MSPRTVWRLNLTGWILFVVSALGFLASTWRARDWVGMFASLAFLVACLAFVLPLWVHRPRN